MRVFAALLFAGLALAGEPREWRVVRGRVLGEDGEPVRGAAIRPSEGDEIVAESAADGTFVFDVLPGAELKMRATVLGYATAWLKGTVRGESPTIELRVRRGSTLHVRVEDETGIRDSGAEGGAGSRPGRRCQASPPGRARDVEVGLVSQPS
jgi:hypothetical protein